MKTDMWTSKILAMNHIIEVLVILSMTYSMAEFLISEKCGKVEMEQNWSHGCHSRIGQKLCATRMLMAKCPNSKLTDSRDGDGERKETNE